MKAPGNDETSIEYEMGYGADEFGNVLTGVFSGAESVYQCELLKTHYWRISQPGTDLKITIKVEEKSPRKIGLFVLPVLQVNFETEKSVPELQEEFFKRFFKYFHKGGG